VQIAASVLFLLSVPVTLTRIVVLRRHLFIDRVRRFETILTLLIFIIWLVTVVVNTRLGFEAVPWRVAICALAARVVTLFRITRMYAEWRFLRFFLSFVYLLRCLSCCAHPSVRLRYIFIFECFLPEVFL